MNASGQSGDYRRDSSAMDARRTALRKEKLAARLALPEGARAAAEAAIAARLEEGLGTMAPAVLAFCWPVRGEVDCRPLLPKLAGLGWRFCQPVVVERERPMVFRAWTPDSPMATDPHGIPVPAAGEILIPDVALIPLVAFDGQGARLGYGGGYFDRTLASLSPRPLAIGVGFDLARVDSILPGVHDIPMDAIVTETGWWNR